MAKKRSGRITLRVKPRLHEQLADVAEDLGVDLNGLLNLLISRSFGEVAAEARGLKHYREEAVKSGTYTKLLNAWRAAYPDSTLKDFLWQFRLHALSEPNELDRLIQPSAEG